MALKPTDSPPLRRDNTETLDEIGREGTPGQWYEVSKYDNPASARDAAFNLRKRYPDMDITTNDGVLKARSKA